jgi:hypothetical protein
MIDAYTPFITLNHTSRSQHEYTWEFICFSEIFYSDILEVLFEVSTIYQHWDLYVSNNEGERYGAPRERE